MAKWSRLEGLKTMDTQIRIATKNDLTWINEKYKEVEFFQADLENDIIAIVESNQNKIGVGRLRIIDSDVFELSGMYVVDSYRKQGVAGKIIKFLLTKVKSHQSVFCIPVPHLESYYKKFGFEEIKDCLQIPKVLKDKQIWCGNKFGGNFSIFKYNPNT